MQDCPSSRSLKSNLAIGAFIGGGLFATALACGVVALGPLAIPIGIVAVGAGGAGGVLFQNIKPSIDETSSNVSSCFTKMISNIEIPTPTFRIHRSDLVDRIIRIFDLETVGKKRR
jgi:hypothetical protein